MKEAKAQRSKRGSTVINLVQTPAGYSIIQGTQLLNKLQHANAPSTHSHSQFASSIQIGSLPSQKQQKISIKQTNLLFLRGKFGNHQVSQSYTSRMKEESKGEQRKYQFADWFDQDKVHDIELNELRLWFVEDYPKVTLQEVEELHEFAIMVNKYKANRNKIIQIFISEFFPSQKYMSTNSIRKFICEDAYWLMRIHIFLNSWGLINFNQLNLQNQNINGNYLFKFNHETKKFQIMNQQLSTRKNDCLIPQIMPETTQQQNLILKNITKNIRPYCDFCGIHCGIVWFQHYRLIDPKEISTIMKNVNSKNPPLSEKQYEIVLCVKCYCDGNFPLLLTHHDFKKVSINDKLEPGKKKKNKKKKKDKRKKIKEKEQVVDEDEEYRYEQEKLQEYKEQDDGSRQNRDKSAKKIQSNEGIEQVNKIDKQQSEKKLAQMINEIISKISKDREFNLEQTNYLLELVNEHEQRWDIIHSQMIKKGYCTDCSTEDLIQYFVTMPKRGVTKLNEEIDNEQFIKQNKSHIKSKFYTKLVQRNLNNAIEVVENKKQLGEQIKINESLQWKEKIDKLTVLNIKKLQTQIHLLEKLQKKAKETHRESQSILL